MGHTYDVAVHSIDLAQAYRKVSNLRVDNKVRMKRKKDFSHGDSNAGWLIQSQQC